MNEIVTFLQNNQTLHSWESKNWSQLKYVNGWRELWNHHVMGRTDKKKCCYAATKIPHHYIFKLQFRWRLRLGAKTVGQINISSHEFKIYNLFARRQSFEIFVQFPESCIFVWWLQEEEGLRLGAIKVGQRTISSQQFKICNLFARRQSVFPKLHISNC